MHRRWVSRLAGWSLWGSLVVFVGVIGIMEISFFAPIPDPDRFREVVWMFLLRPGFALAVAAFLLGVGFHLIEGRIGAGKRRL